MTTRLPSHRSLAWPGAALTCVALSLLACAGPPPETEPGAPVDQPSPEAAVRAAVASRERPEADRADDAARKPGEVLTFFGIEPGMTVLDLLAGGGYYTELLARTVGPDGRVLFHDNDAYVGAVGDQIERRVAGNRLPNVEPLVAEVNELELDPGSLDAVVFVLGYHDIYYAPEDGSWPPIDRDLLLAELHTALRPGGVLGIVDHVAAAGADPSESGTVLHRIDPELVREQVTAAGFELDAESDVLRHAEDDHTRVVFDPAIRRRTDRFVMRFRKPDDA